MAFRLNVVVEPSENGTHCGPCNFLQYGNSSAERPFCHAFYEYCERDDDGYSFRLDECLQAEKESSELDSVSSKMIDAIVEWAVSEPEKDE